MFARAVVAVTLLCLCLPAFAAEGCEARSPMDAALCADPSLAALDAERARLAGLAAGALEGAEALEFAQLQARWRAGRDRCAARGEAAAPCARTATVLRIHDLRARHPALREGEGGSIGPIRFACADGSALSVVFVTVGTGAASVQRGGAGVVLPRVRSGSGGRYALTAAEGGPAEFWTKGREAAYAPKGAASPVICRAED